ncbi:MAG: TolC family protein [Pseudomonadota bacterium]|uniref:efflux transporter outer membrane subunit n=1 Tax=Phenylobacterium sp. TaxID=1871053 RepID=UPI0025EFCEDF|nr:TolC family protein [Phenylobacterium sp.]MBT9470218.1 TolC family protein [Phenylobacterium sp.]
MLRMPLVLLGSLSLFGCASHPPLGSTSAAVASSYRNLSLPTGPTSTAIVRTQWWKSFNDPVLDRLIDEALLGSLDIEAASARLQQAAAASRVATSSALPSGTISGSATTQRQSLGDPAARIASASPTYDRTSELFGLSAAMSWELDLFGRLSAVKRAAGADQVAAAADLAGARLTVAAEIANAYIAARELQTRLQIARERIDTVENLRALVALRFQEGAAARLELDNVEADLAAAQARAPALEAALDQTLDRIDLLSGRAPGKAAAEVGVGALPAALTIDVRDGPAELLARRPDIVAAERRVAAGDARVAEAIAGYYPRVSIAGLVGLLSPVLSDLLDDDSLQSAGTVGLSGRLFDFGATRGQVEAARGRTREAVAGYRRTVFQAVAEVEDGLSRLSRGARQAEDLGRSEAALSRASRVARAGYDIGGFDLRDALEAERRLLDVQDAAIVARADTARASVAVFRALGGGWTADSLQVATHDERRG